ncbi:hypothetical protein B0J11DRAFT_19647 [Dendryphion nanum]|uniref:Uncharacterized protein n=1 Tax=Dendryphion nanum TaxID=256645 RepID=A0A9P9EIN8_9PLEO|nr:hypothetical protein B0J11DRAFT_19647 [Dendryphion nanum]
MGCLETRRRRGWEHGCCQPSLGAGGKLQKAGWLVLLNGSGTGPWCESGTPWPNGVGSNRTESRRPPPRTLAIIVCLTCCMVCFLTFADASPPIFTRKDPRCQHVNVHIAKIRMVSKAVVVVVVVSTKGRKGPDRVKPQTADVRLPQSRRLLQTKKTMTIDLDVGVG